MRPDPEAVDVGRAEMEQDEVQPSACRAEVVDEPASRIVKAARMKNTRKARQTVHVVPIGLM